MAKYWGRSEFVTGGNSHRAEAGTFGVGLRIR